MLQSGFHCIYLDFEAATTCHVNDLNHEYPKNLRSMSPALLHVLVLQSFPHRKLMDNNQINESQSVTVQNLLKRALPGFEQRTTPKTPHLGIRANGCRVCGGFCSCLFKKVITSSPLQAGPSENLILLFLPEA